MAAFPFRGTWFRGPSRAWFEAGERWVDYERQGSAGQLGHHRVVGASGMSFTAWRVAGPARSM
jgi:hypothetical protein